MSIARYARDRWLWGARHGDEEDVAMAYIATALKSRDPAGMLLPAVKAAVAEEFRRRQHLVEDRVPWDELSAKETAATGDPGTRTLARVLTLHPPRRRRYLGTQHPASSLDAINDLLKTHLWVWRADSDGKPADGRMIAWADLTVADIAPTIAHERVMIAGFERRISRLETARDLMLRHGVTRFGDVPFSTEVKELITA